MNKAVKYTCLALSIAVMCFVGMRIYAVNQKYPPAEVITYNVGDTVETSGMSITITGSKIDYAANFIDGYVSGVVDSNNLPLPEDECRLLVIYITIENFTNEEVTIPLYTMYAESGGWANGINMSGFRGLNPNLSQPALTISAGESESVAVPFAMYSVQFKEKDWDFVDKREYGIVLSVYPIKAIVIL